MKNNKLLKVLIAATIIGVPLYLYCKNTKDKIKRIMGVEKGFAHTEEDLESLGIDKDSVAEFLNYTFKSLKALKKEVLYYDKDNYSKDKIKDILIKDFNFGELDSQIVMDNYTLLESFEDNIEALEYLIKTLKEDTLSDIEFRNLILDLYKSINKEDI